MMRVVEWEEKSQWVRWEFKEKGCRLLATICNFLCPVSAPYFLVVPCPTLPHRSLKVDLERPLALRILTLSP